MKPLSVLWIAVAAAVLVGVWLYSQDRTREQDERISARRAQVKARTAERISRGPTVISSSHIDGGVVRILEAPVRITGGYTEAVTCVLFTGDNGSSSIACGESSIVFD